MTRLLKTLLATLLICTSALSQDLLKVREGFKTQLIKKEKIEEALATPPSEVFSIVKYPTKIGKMAAYLSQHQQTSNEKKPAIVWLTGGFPESSPGDYLWTETDYGNDQSARTFRHHGIVMMFPTLRGRAQGNPGVVESFFGEVEDVISAGKYLKTLKHIDPERIYLGGHSTGGTLAVLTAAATNIFAGVIALGPTDDDYGQENAPYKWTKQERLMRNPLEHTASIKTPTYIIEGERGNALSLMAYQLKQQARPNPNIKVIKVKGANHFNCIHPVNRLFARAILSSKSSSLKIPTTNLSNAYLDYGIRQQEAEDLRILTNLRQGGLKLTGKKELLSSFYTWKKEDLLPLINDLKSHKFSATTPKEYKNDEGKTYFGVTFSKAIELSSLKQIFSTSATLRTTALKHDIYYDFWSIKR